MEKQKQSALHVFSQRRFPLLFIRRLHRLAGFWRGHIHGFIHMQIQHEWTRGEWAMNNNYPLPPLLRLGELHDRLLAKGCYDLDAELIIFQICRHHISWWVGGIVSLLGEREEKKEREWGKSATSSHCNKENKSWLLKWHSCCSEMWEESGRGLSGLRDEWMRKTGKNEGIGWQRSKVPVWSLCLLTRRRNLLQSMMER